MMKWSRSSLIAFNLLRSAIAGGILSGALAEHDDDRPEPGGGALGRRIESVERRRDHGPVEGVEPPLVHGQAKPDRPDHEQRGRGSVDPHDSAQSEAVVHACIVGVWKTRPASAS